MASELPTVKKIIGTIEEVTEKMSKQGVSYKLIVINTEGNGCIITTYFDNEFSPCEGDVIKGYVEVQNRYLTLRNATLLERAPAAVHTPAAAPSLSSTSVN